MWQVNTKVIDAQKHIIKVTVTQTDATTGAIYKHSYTGKIHSGAQRDQIRDQIKADYLKSLEKQEQADELLAGFGPTLTNALNDWEETL